MLIDLFLILASVMLLTAFFRLRNTIKTTETRIHVNVLLSPAPDVLVSPLVEPNAIQIWGQATKEWLKTHLDKLHVLFSLMILRLKLKWKQWKQRWSRRKQEGPHIIISGFQYAAGSAGSIVIGASAPIIIKYQGYGLLPKKIYEGDSRNILFDLQPTLALTSEGDVEPLRIQEAKNGVSMTLWDTAIGTDAFLEFEIVAAGFVVEGEKKQRQPLALNHLRYQWNCYFPNSGNHSFIIIIRAINSDRPVKIGRIEHLVRVVKLDHLTQRQVWTIATLAGIVSGVVAFAEALHRLGLW